MNNYSRNVIRWNTVLSNNNSIIFNNAVVVVIIVVVVYMELQIMVMQHHCMQQKSNSAFFFTDEPGQLVVSMGDSSSRLELEFVVPLPDFNGEARSCWRCATGGSGG